MRRCGHQGAQLGHDAHEVDQRVVVHLGHEGGARRVGGVHKPSESLLGNGAAAVARVGSGRTVVRL